MNLKKGEILELEITSYAFEGKGVSRVNIGDKNNYVIFVDNAYPGDIVAAELKKIKSSYAEAKAKKIIKPSMYRTNPKCKYFGICGGCKLQDLVYEKQLEYKSSHVKDTFERIGGFQNVEFLPIIGADSIYYYRNKMEYSFLDKKWLTKEDIEKNEKYDNFAVGLHVPGFYDKVLDIDECFLQKPISVEILNAARNFFKARKISCFSPKTKQGFLRHLVIKTSFRFPEQTLVNLVTSLRDDNLLNEYVKFLTDKFNLTTIACNINKKISQTALSEEEIIYYGDGYIYDKIGDYVFRISSNSFFQNNTLQAERLYSIALNFAELEGNESVLDLYSGIGTISLFFSKCCKKVIGLEGVGQAVTDANYNATINNVNNVEFYEFNLFERFSSEEFIKSNKPDVIIVDPPRAGLHPNNIKDILSIKPRKIVYVSCNPATQARDLKALCDNDYKIIKVCPVDMFPNTWHIENVCLLQKKH